MGAIYHRWLKKFFNRRPTLLNPTEKTLFSELVFLMKTFFFVYVGISIKFDSLISLLIGFADYEKVSGIIVKDLKNGYFGKITLDRIK